MFRAKGAYAAMLRSIGLIEKLYKRSSAVREIDKEYI
jgi:hypothetical protein